MKRRIGKRASLLLSAWLLLFLLTVSARAEGVWGLATQKLATRDGPGTTYNEKGTYNVAGQYIRVLSRAWDKRNNIWWVKCEIPYRNEIRVLWTGYKRFDSSTLPLESIPIDSQYPGGGKTQTAAPKPSSSAGLWGLAKQKLATRDGPGTTYNEKGTYNVAGQYIRVLSRAWDKRNNIWWVKCEIPYRNEIRVLWTGYKRFDSGTLPLESIPIEGETAPVTQPPASAGWSKAYQTFVQNRRYLSSDQVYYNTATTGWYEIAFALYDMDQNGVPELIVSDGEDSMAGRTNHVYTYSGGNVLYLGEIGFRESVLFYLPGSSFPGLFCRDGNMGSYETEYYFLSGLYLGKEEVLVEQYYSDSDPYTMLQTPILKRITGNQALYQTSVSFPAGTVNLTMYTRSQISSMGWNGFVARMP